jgi:hypothetical protein
MRQLSHIRKAISIQMYAGAESFRRLHRQDRSQRIPHHAMRRILRHGPFTQRIQVPMKNANT